MYRSIMPHVACCCSGSSLLYGEVLPSGVTKLLDSIHLDASRAHVLYDLGCGIGKLAVQAWLQWPHLTKVVGVEVSGG